MNVNKIRFSLLLIISILPNSCLATTSQEIVTSFSLGLMIGNTNVRTSCEERKIIAGLCTCVSIIGAAELAYKSRNQDLKTNVKAWFAGYLIGMSMRD